MKPALCYVRVPGAAPGKRIGIVKRGERGYYATDLDIASQSTAQIDAFVVMLNERMGVDGIEAYAMLCGSMFGWDVPAARTGPRQ